MDRWSFSQNRLEIKSLTAMTGGGQLSLAGYLAYQHGIYADLTATGSGIRIRYPQGSVPWPTHRSACKGRETICCSRADVLITRFTKTPTWTSRRSLRRLILSRPSHPPTPVQPRASRRAHHLGHRS